MEKSGSGRKRGEGRGGGWRNLGMREESSESRRRDGGRRKGREGGEKEGREGREEGTSMKADILNGKTGMYVG
jgi:hypothetical protein